MLDLFAEEQFIYLATGGDHLLVRIHDGTKREELKKLVPSVRKDKATGDWRVPASHDFVKKLRELNLPFTGDATKYSVTLRNKERTLIEASSQKSGELSLPGFMVEMYPFQKAGVLYALERKRTIFGDDMGLGKTVQGLATAYALNAFPLLVVTPTSNKYQWAEFEIPRALPNHRVCLAGKKTKLAELQKADVIVTSYHQMVGFRNYIDHEGKKTRTVWTDQTKKIPVPSELAKHLMSLRLQGIILDESHYIKELDASYTKVIMDMRHGVPVRLPMTGTVFLNKPAELLSPLKFMDRLDEFGGHWHFLQHFCDFKQGYFGADYSGASNTVELNTRLRASCYIRRLKDEVLTELPDKLRTTVLCDIDNRPEYDHAEKELIDWVQMRVDRDHKFLDTIKHLNAQERARAIAVRKQEKMQAAEKGEIMVRISALKKVTSEGKLHAAKQWIDDFLKNGKKLVIFATHEHVHEFLLKHYPSSARILSRDSAEERQRNVKRFQEDDDCLTLIGAQGTSAGSSPAGVGHTLTAASSVLTLELGWNNALHDQCEDRCYRIGQKDTVNCYYLLGRNTIDVKIANLIESKRKTGREVMDGKEGDMGDGILDELIDWLEAR